jgi:hypothetical protein
MNNLEERIYAELVNYGTAAEKLAFMDGAKLGLDEGQRIMNGVTSKVFGVEDSDRTPADNGDEKETVD